MYKQVIVVNKGFKMSAGKLAAQVSHASMSFLSYRFLHNKNNNKVLYNEGGYHYECLYKFDKEIFELWLDGAFTKVIVQVKMKMDYKKL